MSQYFIRCPHCSYPHGEETEHCPVTGKPMPARKGPASLPAPGSTRPLLSVDTPVPDSSGDSFSTTNPAADSSEPPPAETVPPLPTVPRPPPPESIPPSSPAGSLEAVIPTEQNLPEPNSGHDTLIGTTIDDRYEVLRVLGGGGMAAVFEGEQINNGRPVAIKVLPFPMVQSRESLQRFFNEAKLTAALTDANICSIYDYGMLDDGRPYYVMERLRGQPLSEQVKHQDVLALLDAVEITMQVLSGLRTAHKRGIIHRDVKPANVFLHERADGRIQVKLLDFGVAKEIGEPLGSTEDTTLTHTGCVMGTPFYLSPEQILGNRDIDARVDLWAVGVVLHECIAGRRPFVARNFPELASKIVYDAHRPMWERRPATPESLQRVVDRALAKAPEARYQKASHFLRDLQVVRMALIRDHH